MALDFSTLQSQIDELRAGLLNHALRHEKSGGDTVRLSVFNGTTQLNLQRALAAGTGLTATEVQGANPYINLTVASGFIGAPFVTIGNDSTLTAERALTGTSNQITITDNGANSTVVLSLPQDIATGSSPTFVGLTLSGDLAVNGGDLTSTATTFNLLNATVTTLNLGSAVTSLRIGAATVAVGVGAAPVAGVAFNVFGAVAEGTRLLTIGNTTDSYKYLDIYSSGTTAASYSIATTAVVNIGSSAARPQSLNLTGGITVQNSSGTNTFGGFTDITAGGLRVKGNPTSPSADTANTNSRIFIAGGSDAGANDTTVDLAFFRTTAQLGTIGFDGSTATVGGVAMAAADLKFTTATVRGFIDDSDSGRLVWGSGGMRCGGTLQLVNALYPSTDAAASQTAAAIYAGSGAPNNANGANGDFYLRSDGVGGSNNTIYHKETGAWVGLTA